MEHNKSNTLTLEQELSKKEKGINDFLNSKGMKMGDGPIQLICGIAKYFKDDSDLLFAKNEVNSMATVLLIYLLCVSMGSLCPYFFYSLWLNLTLSLFTFEMSNDQLLSFFFKNRSPQMLKKTESH